MQPDSNWLDLTGSFLVYLPFSLFYPLYFCLSFFVFLYFACRYYTSTGTSNAMARELSRPFTSFGAGLPFRSSLWCSRAPQMTTRVQLAILRFFLSSPLISPLKVLNMMQYSLPSCYQKAPKSECLKNQAILWSLFWCGLSEHYYVSGSLDSHGMRPIFHNSWFIPPLITSRRGEADGHSQD